MPAEKILVVEDDPDLRELLRWHLHKEGFVVSTAADGEEAIETFLRERPAVVLLDLMLPGVDGWRVCRQLRAMNGFAFSKVIMLSARTEENDVLRGLEIGADDYVRKPFRPKEVIARIRAVMRRRTVPGATSGGGCVTHGPLALDHEQREVRVNGHRLSLTATEYNLLRLLATNPGRVLTREQLLAGMNPQVAPATGRSIDVHVRALRRKLGDCAEMIETSRGVGYRLQTAPHAPVPCSATAG